MSDLLEDGPPEGPPAGTPETDAAVTPPASRPSRSPRARLLRRGGGRGEERTKDTAATPLLGRAAPVVQTTTIDGQPFDLATRRGSWVVLNFFSTWCVPCVQEHPNLVRFAAGQAAQPDGAELYSVVFNDDPGKVQQFFTEKGGDWRAWSTDGRIRSRSAWPVARDVDHRPNGVVRAPHHDRDERRLTSLLEQLQSGGPPTS
jgi:thiol-disulfide isomerase/thioredoxin